MNQELWEIYPPLEGESAAAWNARLAAMKCADTYIKETDALGGNVEAARETCIIPVFDGNALHAMQVMDKRAAVTAARGYEVTRAAQIVQDVLARRQIKLQTGVLPGSPVPADKLILAPSNPAQYLADEAIIDAAIGRMLAQTYTVLDVPVAP